MPLKASYDIPLWAYDDLFDEYVVALTDAFYNLPIDNGEVIESRKTIGERLGQDCNVFFIAQFDNAHGYQNEWVVSAKASRFRDPALHPDRPHPQFGLLQYL